MENSQERPVRFEPNSSMRMSQEGAELLHALRQRQREIWEQLQNADDNCIVTYQREDGVTVELGTIKELRGL